MLYQSPLPTLPEYTGPHKVGSAEYEIPIGSLGLQQPAEGFCAPTIRFRLFYPAKVDNPATKGIYWVPEPQTTYLDGYLKMARVSPWLSSVLLSVPLFLRSTTFPAYENAPMSDHAHPVRVLIFSHGLVGSMNTHSAILGELASHGICCVAIEHRDGSGAVSLVRNSKAASLEGAPTEMSSIFFRRVSLKIRPGVLEERDEQLRTRIFELMALYRALELLNEGATLENLALKSTSQLQISQGSLQLDPGSVIWGAHSFGGSTVIQLLKSVFYEKGKDDNETGGLLLQDPFPSFKAQITPHSPVVLLDPWFMPLKSPGTQDLFKTPLPCHHTESKTSQDHSSTMVIMSTEFAYHWPECHSHMPAIISPEPSTVKVQTMEEYEEEFKKFTSPRDFMNKSKKAKAQAQAQATSALGQTATGEKSQQNNQDEVEKRAPISMFEIHETTHITMSDFGLLFQWLTWWFTGQKNPELAVKNIARLILEAAGETAEVPWDEAAKAQIEQVL
jgi:platelet-activating factor acetylhydrolase